MFHFHRFHDDQRLTFLDTVAYFGHHLDHAARHHRSQSPSVAIGVTFEQKWIDQAQGVACIGKQNGDGVAVGKDPRHFGMAVGAE